MKHLNHPSTHSFNRWLALWCLGLCCAKATTAQAGLLGATVNVSAYYPDNLTVFQAGSDTTVSGAIEYPTGTFDRYNSSWQIDITDTRITISDLQGTGFPYGVASFNGWILTIISGPDILSAVPGAASQFDPVGIAIRNGNQLLLNYSGVQGPMSGTSILDITTGPTPCPATITVTTTGDSGSGSLRQAILDANACPGANIIDFAPSAYGTITLTSGELLVADYLFIDGPGSAKVAVNGNAADRVFHIRSNTVVSISGLTITNGRVSAGFSTALGAGIWNDHATLTVSNCTLSGNRADFGGGGIGNFSFGASGSARLTILNSTLSGNLGEQGGGIWNDGERGGSASLQIVNSTLSGNSARLGGGILNTDFTGGSASVLIVNSTLSGNSATEIGGGIDNANLHGSASSLRIFNSTLSGNSAAAGGCIINQGELGPASLEIASTILNAGASGGTIANQSGAVTSLGYSLSSDAGGGVLTNTTDQTNTDPLLGPLQDNGGPGFTHAFLCRSPAVDKGKNFSASATDQRGVGLARTFDDPAAPNAPGGDGTDIGAFEAQQPLPDCNHPPVAVIRVSPLVNLPGLPGLVVIAANNATVCVALDGSLSSDPDQDSLTYQWFNEPVPLPFASGVTATGCLNLGTHTIQLVVTDAHGASGTNSVTVVAISPSAAVAALIAAVDDAALEPRNTRPFLATLTAAGASFDRGDQIAGVNQLQAFQNKVRAQIAPVSPALAQQLINTAQAIIDALSGP